MTARAFDVLWVVIGALVVIGAMCLAWYAAKHPDPPPNH